MSVSLLLDMAAAVNPDRLAVVCDEVRWTASELSARAGGGAAVIANSGARSVAYVGTGGHLLPLLIFASAGAAIPFTPLNYRLAADSLGELIARLDDPLVVCDDEYHDIVAAFGGRIMRATAFAEAAATTDPRAGIESPDPDEVAVVLFTSGTTAKPKAVELSHNNLVGYITGTVDFDSAEPADAALICVPPYHIAGISAALSNLYAGRTMVYLRNFDAARWVELAGSASVTTATVVPTMLDRILTELQRCGAKLPALRNLAYGGAKVALPLVRKALDLLPEVGFVNAYGLTETSSTIAVLGPADHRTAHRSGDPAVARRLGSVGRPVPGIEVQIRDDDGRVLPAGATGELFVRGPQVSGRYTGIGSVLDEEGWFPTKDVAMLDADGYLFIGGRADDTIIRGGENIAPAEIEDVLVEHPAVREVAVVGVEDAQWGQIIVAVVVPANGATPDPAALRDYVRARLRGSRTPDRIVFRDSLPTTPTGKVLRRELADEYGPQPVAET
ncbi:MULTISPECIES: class I adenylate-forming enzyme family protein [Nocardia]|uniref:Fatty acid--CoA ligase family protein n=1 Tax=Nocardia implantans TaxID=3108168 RepID=A0ABU6ARL2_9NOCA|nr:MULTISPECIES: fatty acid--CoA ligase family protein [unclassified Nocardia]MBF6191568.1 long-chain fatty acid--CoA ligase [Nocardia beijingensis]MEA3528125.1 fatty acid--CoA ligase family protein [Nocardia sp. CDC192]MEB3510123.1 fatty acid--CoA ligase family protein [Nocardia sp. CDC186]